VSPTAIYLRPYNQNLELLVGLEHALHIDRTRAAIQPQVPPWECSRLNANNSLERSSMARLRVNFESLERTSGELSVDSAPAIGKILACGDSSPIEAEENIAEDGGLERDSPAAVHHKSERFVGADEGCGADCATARGGEASDTSPIETDVAVGEPNGLNRDLNHDLRRL